MLLIKLIYIIFFKFILSFTKTLQKRYKNVTKTLQKRYKNVTKTLQKF